VLVGDMACHAGTVDGTVSALPAAVSGVLVEVRIDRHAIRAGRSDPRVPERGGVEVLEMVGQGLAYGRRDAVLLPEVIADVPGGDP
jgi:hypothetical protein